MYYYTDSSNKTSQFTQFISDSTSLQYFCEKVFRYHPNLIHTHIIMLKNIFYDYNEKILQL